MNPTDINHDELCIAYVIAKQLKKDSNGSLMEGVVTKCDFTS